MQGLYGYSPLNGGRTRTLPGSESHRTRCVITPLLGFQDNKKERKINVLEVRGGLAYKELGDNGIGYFVKLCESEKK